MERKTILSISLLAFIFLAFIASEIDPIEKELKKISLEYETYHLYDKKEKYRDSMAIVNKKLQDDYKHYNDSMRKVTGDTNTYYYRPLTLSDWSQMAVWGTAIMDCNGDYTPPSGDCDTMQFSHAPFYASPHGDKLYRLFVKDFNAYSQKLSPQPIGQVLVKEVWEVKEVIGTQQEHVSFPILSMAPIFGDTTISKRSPVAQDSIKAAAKTLPDDQEYYYYQKVVRNDKWQFYTPKRKIELFIMYKTTPSETNDLGWVYGTMDISEGLDKGKVIQFGPINKCVKCHAETKYDRIFGPYN